MKYLARCSVCGKEFEREGELMPVAGILNVSTEPHGRADNEAIPCLGEGQPLLGIKVLRG